jgi:hypothetical protein
MDSQWHIEDSDSGFGHGPKLTMTGRLRGTFAGRPVEFVGEGRELCLHVADFRTAWALRRNLSTWGYPLFRLIRSHMLQLDLRVGRRWVFQVLPRTSLPLRLLLPDLRVS